VNDLLLSASFMKTSKAQGPARVYRILLVDDNRNGLLARKSVLEEHGYTVDAFSAPVEAVAQFEAITYDLVVTDYRMPKLNGAELISAIRAIRPEIKVILVSGVADVLGLDEKSTGADMVIPKSSTEVTHLIRAAKRLMEPHTPKKPVRSATSKKPRKQSASQ
jgi:CheY-like chemotaxis protein